MLLAPRRQVGEFRARYRVMAAAVVVVFGLLASRLLYLQLVSGATWRARASSNITKTLGRPATRGMLYDARGEVIASNRPRYDVLVIPAVLDRDPRHAERLGELLGLETGERAAFAARLEAVPESRRSHQVEMFADIDREQLAALTTHADALPGVTVRTSPIRAYPSGGLGAHVVGYMNEVTAEDLERRPGQGYRAGDRIGRNGLERSLESVLRGRRGYREVMVDARGRPQGREQGGRAAVPGRDVALTIDMELMRAAERAFQGHASGGLAVVEVRTGRVRALFSKPSYDPNAMTGGVGRKAYAAMLRDPFRPLIDKTLYETYFPGSTFKPFTALAALGSGVVSPSDVVECPGFHRVGRQRMRCNARHGEVDLHEAITRSCNVYFWRLADELGLPRLNETARALGFAERTGIGINSESPGFLATRGWYEEHYGRFTVGYTLNTAIGQGNTRSTVLQLALSYAALANGGTLYVPQLVEQIRDPSGEVLEEIAPRVRRQVPLDPDHVARVNRAMRDVVHHPLGTAYGARVAGGVTVAGKTGTAEVVGENRRSADAHFHRSHAWFAGFAPAEAPEVAIAVLVEHGGGGGRHAAPIATRVLNDYLSRPRLAARHDTTPNDEAMRGEGGP